MNFFALMMAVFSLSLVSANGAPCFVITPDFPHAYESAAAVFIGEVVKISEPINTSADAPLADRMHKVTFRVEYSWKGAGFQQFGFPELDVLSNQGIRAGCFSRVTFLERTKYLVYADESTSGSLIVQAGDRTQVLSNAGEDLKRLERMNPFFIRTRPLVQNLGDPNKQR